MASRCKGQANRLTNIARRMKVGGAASTSSDIKRTSWQENEYTLKASCKHARCSIDEVATRNKGEAKQMEARGFAAQAAESPNQLSAEPRLCARSCLHSETEGAEEPMQAYLNLMKKVKLEEPIHAAKILRIAGQHTKEANKLSDAAVAEIWKQTAAKNNDTQKRGLRNLLIG